MGGVYYIIITYDYGKTFHKLSIKYAGVLLQLNNIALTSDNKYIYMIDRLNPGGIYHVDISTSPTTTSSLTWIKDTNGGYASTGRIICMTNTSPPTIFSSNGTAIYYYALPSTTAVLVNFDSSSNGYSIRNLSCNNDGSILVCGLNSSSKIGISYNKIDMSIFSIPGITLGSFYGIAYCSKVVSTNATILFTYNNEGVSGNQKTYVGNVTVSTKSITWANVSASTVPALTTSNFVYGAVSITGNILIVNNNTAVSYSLNNALTWTTVNFPTALTSTSSTIISSDGSTFICTYSDQFIWGTTGVLG
jgi:hypothetical protein